MKNKTILKYFSVLTVVFLLLTMFTGCGVDAPPTVDAGDALPLTSTEVAEENIQHQNPILSASMFTGEPFVTLNNNKPTFIRDEKTITAFENYAELDSLGRCGVAYACLGKELMPTEERESLSSVKPSGWNNQPYDFIDGGWIYNRCHLIGFQLAGEQANAKNLITGTRYFNVQGMLPFENMVADYIRETENHVMYRVTPIYTGDNLVCEGVIIEAYSVEDSGEGICFNVFCYNVQPDITINYANGDNWLANEEPTTEAVIKYILNTRTLKFHLETCSSATSISSNNKKEFTGTKQELIDQGYSACGVCKP